MSQINVNSEDKETFDELKPEDMTQAEFFNRVIQVFEVASEPVIVDPEEIAEDITVKVASNVELAAHRGVDSALEDHP